MTKYRNKCSAFFTVLSVGLLYPGLTLPMLKLKLNGDLNSSVGQFGMTILDKRNSIIDTIFELASDKQVFVALMIFIFSLLIPVLKAATLLAVTRMKTVQMRQRVFSFVRMIAKWSMADVMLVAIFLAFLSTRAQPSQVSHQADIMGFVIDINVFVGMSSELGEGFYYFFAYCMCSMLGLQFFQLAGDLGSAKIE